MLPCLWRQERNEGTKKKYKRRRKKGKGKTKRERKKTGPSIWESGKRRRGLGKIPSPLISFSAPSPYSEGQECANHMPPWNSMPLRRLQCAIHPGHDMRKAAGRFSQAQRALWRPYSHFFLLFFFYNANLLVTSAGFLTSISRYWFSNSWGAEHHRRKAFMPQQPPDHQF